MAMFSVSGVAFAIVGDMNCQVPSSKQLHRHPEKILLHRLGFPVLSSRKSMYI